MNFFEKLKLLKKNNATEMNYKMLFQNIIKGIYLSVFLIIILICVFFPKIATVYKGNIIKNLIMDCQSYTKYRPNETTGGIFVSWRRKEELPTGV